MDHDALRSLIQQKLTDGRLPHDSIPRIWGGAADGDMCDACDEAIPGGQYVIEGVSVAGVGKRALQLHVRCFYLRDEERFAPGR
jgi:hypothetical protein